MQKIAPFLWFNDDAGKAVKFYTSIFKKSRIRKIAHYPEGTEKAAGRPAGSVMTIEFELWDIGQPVPENSPNKKRHVLTGAIRLRDRHSDGMKPDNSKLDADGKLKNGVFRESYKDGTLACVGKYRNGGKAGVWRYYLRNGQLRAIGKFTGGKMTGEWKWYRENGRLMQTGSFLAEKKSGVWKRYQPNGVLYDEGKFADDQKIGEWRVYDARGKLRKTSHHRPKK
jgi:uncharacterized glyoxalase superfamily protein PhnB